MELVERPRRTPGIAPRLVGALVALAGALVLSGWAFDIAVFKSPLPGSVSMKPNAALGFVLAGLALLASPGSFSSRPTLPARLGRLCGLLAGLIGLLSLGEYLFGTSFGIDQLLFTEPAGTLGTSNPGRMAPDTALCFALLGAALWLAGGKRGSVWNLLLTVTLATLVVTLGLATLLSHATTDFGAPGWWGLTMMAVHTAGLLVALGVAVNLLAWRSGALPWALGRGTTAAFASGMAILVFISLSTSRGIVRLRHADHRVAQAESTRQTVSRLLANLARAQSDARGYLMSGDDRLADAATAAMADCRVDLAEVDRLMDADANHHDSVELDRVVGEALAWWHQSVANYGESQQAAEERARVSHGQLLMDRVRATIGRIQEDQGRRLASHQKTSQDLIALTGGVVTAGTLVSLGIFLAALLAVDRAAAERKRAVADLSTSNKELEQFAYVASHDLQEPLRMVSSYTQLLAERYKDQLDDKARQYIDYAVDGAVRMQRLINDLLVYSRVHSRGAPPVATDAHAVLGEALANLATTIGETGALVTNDDLPTLPADPTQLLQLFQNLIGNAIKFRGTAPPRIHVSARDVGHEWLFSVRDNGIGIDPQYASRLFVIFQRLHTRQEYPGTGIGLALCRRVVERHGGRIWFESEPGKGSTFFFTFPK